MGYNVQRFHLPVDPNLVCSVCSSVLADAVLTPCGHTFCLECITTWLNRPATDTCPECRSHVSVNHLKPVLALRSLILGLDVCCDHSQRGCKVVVKLDRLASHLETCGYAPIRCAGCDNTVNKFELATHQIRCEGIANSVREDDEDDDNTTSQRLSKIRFSHSWTSIDLSELISKIATLEFQVKTLKRDLQIAESKNRVMEREFRKTKEELAQKRRALLDFSSDFDPDYEYGYTPQSIAKLSFLIARFLLKKPSYIDRDKIFSAVRRCYDKFSRCRSEYEHDVHMLVATAFASNWFTESYRSTLHYWLQGIARHRQLTLNSAKYSQMAKA